MKFTGFLDNIKVELIEESIRDSSRRAFEFNSYGMDRASVPEKYNSYNWYDFFQELQNGTTFPKYVYSQKISFKITGISRICLAQLTRDAAIFCSESHGLRPLDMHLVLPNSILDDSEVMKLYKKAMEYIEKAYIVACEHDIPYPESRYLGPHSQTISVCASYELGNFIRACKSRTNNSFCDELNFVYRYMYVELIKAVEQKAYGNDQELWDWLLKDCINDSYYTRTNVFNGDFSPEEAKSRGCRKPAQNDWRKSGWKKDLETLLKWCEEKEEPWLTPKEMDIVRQWIVTESAAGELYTSYNKGNPRASHNAIKNTDYYKNYREVKDEN